MGDTPKSFVSQLFIQMGMSEASRRGMFGEKGSIIEGSLEVKTSLVRLGLE